MNRANASVTNIPKNAKRRSPPPSCETMSARISTATASQEAVRADCSLKAPNISSAIAPAMTMISGSAGKTASGGSSGTSPALLETCATHARCLRGGTHLLDHMIDRGLDRAQKRIRIDAHPHDQDQQRSEHHLLSQAQIQHATQIGAREGAENHPPIHVEHVHWAEE